MSVPGIEPMHGDNVLCNFFGLSKASAVQVPLQVPVKCPSSALMTSAPHFAPCVSSWSPLGNKSLYTKNQVNRSHAGCAIPGFLLALPSFISGILGVIFSQFHRNSCT
jgi:hypothetical protein